ncbi:MAG: response regulator [Gammaproteobacteria bacterium]
MPNKLDELAVSALSKPILIINRQTAIVRCNAATVHLFDYPEDHLLTLTLAQLLAESEQRIQALLEQWEQNDQFVNEETAAEKVLVRRPHGVTFPLAICGRALKLGRKRYYMLELCDLSADQRIQQAMLSARNQANDAAVAKAQFMALISHEIRNPITTMLSTLNLLLNTPLNDNQHSLLETAHSAGDSLRNIINDILDYTSLEAGSIEPKLSDFDLITLVESVAELLAPQAFAKQLAIATLIRPDVARCIRNDSLRIRQILLQLTDNAIKYTSSGGVCIRVMPVSDTSSQPLLRFEVTDTGPGIAPEDQERLFQAFTQNAPAYSRKYGGLGLGLATCKRLVELLDGEMGLSSTLDGGSTFWFELPYQAVQTDISEPPLAIEKLAGLRVLLIEHNPVSSKAHQELLLSWGLQVTLAHNEHEALQALQTSPGAVDVALIDQYFCDSQQTCLAQTIRQTPGLENTCMVLLMEMGAYSTLQRMQEIGFQAFLSKPIRQAGLYRWLSVVIGLDNRDETENRLIEELSTNAEEAPHHYRILLVEDSYVNQAVAIAMLKHTGYRIDAVDNGLEALQALRSQPYDLILMDLSMPEMDGFETTARIRALTAPMNRIPIIAVSANVIPEDRERLHKLGINDYVTKPIDRKLFLAAIKRWLQPTETALIEQDETLPILDEPTLEKLADETNPTIMRRIIGLFIEETQNRADHIITARSNGDLERLQREAHSLKSSAGTFGALRLQARAKALEAACRDQQAERYQKLAESMPELVRVALQAMQTYLDESVPPA